MGGWNSTCHHCKSITTKEMKNGREANYCLEHEKYMIGKFPPGLEWTKTVCFEEDEDVVWFE